MEGGPWSAWSCADVGRWLRAQGFGEHEELFAANKISGSILPELTRNALRDDLGIAAFGDRVRIAQAIETLIASSPGDASTSTSPATSTSATSQQLNQAWLPRDDNALDLVVLHAAPLVIKDSRHRIYPMEKLDLEAERREISNSLLTDVQHKAIHVRFDIASADILRSLMTAWKCTVLHFSGHGLGQRAALCFEDGAGCTHLITPDALRQLMFSGDRKQQQVAGATPVEMKTAEVGVAGPKPLDGNVQLVFVNACHSQKVASVFLNAGIPHVVAKLSTVRYAIAQSIGMPAADTDEEVFAELGTKNCLLVLDKVEELLDEDENKGEELLHQLISVAPNLKLLLASRRNMHIPSVTPYSLSISELPLHTARDDHRFETIRELNQVGHKDFEIEAAEAVLSSVLTEQNAAGKLLSNMDGFGFDNDGAMTNDSYDLLDLESSEEVKAREASHAYRFDGTLALFDKERANIESAMRLAHELTQQSIEQVRENNRRAQQDLHSGKMPKSLEICAREGEKVEDGTEVVVTEVFVLALVLVLADPVPAAKSLKIREMTLGENHPQVAQSLNNLALYLSNQLETQQRSEEELAAQRAEIGRLYERALRIRRSTLGNASFETAATLNNMGNFKRLTKDWRGAEENIKEALQITDRYFNDISPRAARIFINLARVYRDQKRFEEAINAYKKAQDIRQQLFPDTRDVGFCIGKEEEGRVVEERGRQMKKLGLSAMEQDEMGQEESNSSTSSESISFKHAVLSGDSAEGSVSSGHLFTLNKWSKGRSHGSKTISPQTMPEAYIQITSTSEAALERAKEQSLCIREVVDTVANPLRTTLIMAVAALEAAEVEG
eukprot:jgi/Phyca11/17333/fgenesh1_pg.PHYCAscaffold_27_\